jgi:hypothetical protein
MIVEILIAECDAKYALPDECCNLVFDQLRAPLIVKAGRKAIDQSDCTIRRTKQQRAGV